jgi:hypothetical protein
MDHSFHHLACSFDSEKTTMQYGLRDSIWVHHLAVLKKSSPCEHLLDEANSLSVHFASDNNGHSKALASCVDSVDFSSFWFSFISAG